MKENRLILKIYFLIKHMNFMLKNDFIEINLRMLLDYENIKE